MTDHPGRELPILRSTYDFLLWLLPRLARLPRQHRHLLGDLLARNLHAFLQGLVEVRWGKGRIERLERLSGRLDAIRYQIRMLHDLDLIDSRRQEHCARSLVDIGRQLGAWLRKERGRRTS